jgi:hypothetical protein
MGKEKNLEVELLDATQAWKKHLPTWLKKSKWDIVCEKDGMTCPLYYRPLYHIIVVSIFNLLHWR